MIFSNKRILVTGGSGSIGKVICEYFSTEGAEVLSIDKISSKGAYKTEVVDFILDEDWESRLVNIVEAMTTIDVLINCAGFTNDSVNIFDLQNLNHNLKVNLIVPFKLISLAISKALSKNMPLSIINVTSLWSLLGFPKNPSYKASKASLAQLTRSITVDFASESIRCNNLVPGYIKSNMTLNSWSDEEMFGSRKNRTAMSRWGMPEDLIGAVKFLASPDSAYVTGLDLVVDGGWSVKGL